MAGSQSEEATIILPLSYLHTQPAPPEAVLAVINDVARVCHQSLPLPQLELDQPQPGPVYKTEPVGVSLLPPPGCPAVSSPQQDSLSLH